MHGDYDKNQEIDLSLLKKISEQDEKALQEILIKYTPMVKRIIRGFHSGFLEGEDLTQEGLIGLLSAVREYDGENFRIKFSSFAYMCILRKICNVVKSSNGNKHRILNHSISLYAFVNESETRTVLDIFTDGKLNPEISAEEKWVNQHLTSVLSHYLSALEYRVVILILQGYGMSEIAGMMGLAMKSVDNARTRAKLKIKNLIQKYGTLLNPKLLSLAK